MTVEDLDLSLVSDGQRLLRFIENRREGSGVMNVPVTYVLRGELDVSALQRALDSLVARHESLRTRFVRRERLYQAVHPPFGVPIVVSDLTDRADPWAEAYTLLAQRLLTNIPVLSDWPFTVDLVRTGGNEHILLLNVHHLVTDAWSNMLICRDLGYLYSREIGHVGADLPPVQWQFRDYVRWEEERLAGPAAIEHERYWIDRLDQASFVGLAAPQDDQFASRPPSKNVWFTITGEQVAQLRGVATENRTTLFVVASALFAATLYAASGQRELAFGSIFANRGRPEVASTVGFFANMVVLDLAVPESATTLDFVEPMRQTVLQALGHQQYPYRRLAIGDRTSRSQRASEVVFHMLAAPPKVDSPEHVSFAGLEIEQLRIPDGMGTRFDLELLLLPRRDCLDGVFRYSHGRYDAHYVERLSTTYLGLLDALVTHPNQQIPVPIAQHPEQGAMT